MPSPVVASRLGRDELPSTSPVIGVRFFLFAIVVYILKRLMVSDHEWDQKGEKYIDIQDGQSGLISESGTPPMLRSE